MRHNVPVECAAEPCGVTHKTAFEWRHRVLATVSGYQDRIVLRDTVWVDKTYVNDTDLSKGSFIAAMRAAGMRVRPARNEVLDGIRHACDALRYGVETLRMYNRERPYRSLVLAQCRSDW